MIKSNKVIAIPRGAIIKERLDERNISKKEFIVRMEMSKMDANKLINDEILLTKDIALKLELILEIPYKFWLNLEEIYRGKLKMIVR